jgi:hypothetical protein
MWIILTIFLATNSIGPWARAAENKIPASLATEIQRFFSGAKTITTKACALGSEKQESYGLLLELKAPVPPAGAQKHRLAAVIALQAKNGWILDRMNSSSNYEPDKGHDFLVDFSTREGTFDPKSVATEGYDLRCTNPHRDPDANIKSMGAFTAPFDEKKHKGAQHLCFQASNVYNNWNCFSVLDKDRKPRASFTQARAD